MAKQVRVKRRCCKSGPRCKRCPVVYKRLARAGLATREGKRTYRVSPDLKKRHLRAARH